MKRRREPARRSTVDNPAILDVEGVRVRVGLRSRTAVYQMQRNWPDFPAPFRPLSDRGHPRWWAVQVDAFIQRHFRPSEEKETA